MATRRAGPGRRFNFAIVVAVIAALSASLVFPERATAKKAQERPPKVKACMAAYDGAIGRVQSGQLIEAGELLLSCVRGCAFLRQECAKRYSQIASEIPSVVPVVTDDKGAPRALVELRIDGKLVTSRLDGHGVAVDPGLHEFSFATDSGVFSTKRVLVVQGQRDRILSATLRAGAEAAPIEKRAPQVAGPPATAEMVAEAEEAPAQGVPGQKVAPDLAAVAPHNGEEEVPAVSASTVRSTPAIPTLSYVLGGTGVAALGGAVLLTLWGRKDSDRLSACSPSCPESSAVHIHRLYLTADVSVGVGVAALGAAYWAYRHARGGGSPEESSPGPEAYLFGIQPTLSGTVGTIGGSF